ncbi:alpha/beta hydrolase family protein [Dechloromonas sp. A34]|uniref:alpha/beta hydrolase family protein n=1 Tax=Dechloromonas sp. A34 TaxID=447588 RepID=UPI002248A05C|nr:hypothetical protein [Dechloromonas sp. A34]
MKSLHLVLCFLVTLMPPVQAQEVLRDLPASIDVNKKYLFFQHGLSVEQLGPDSYSKEFRKTYDTTGLTNAFAKAGYVVIAEFRPKGSRVPAYADKISGQITQLLTTGVPPKNIAVVGHSKGGYITIATATRLANPGIHYAILAGCALPSARNIGGADARATYEKLIADTQGQLKGRILSQYDTTDDWMGSCKDLQAANAGLTIEETAIQSGYAAGMGHSLFYTPEPIWFEPLVKWLAQ